MGTNLNNKILSPGIKPHSIYYKYINLYKMYTYMFEAVAVIVGKRSLSSIFLVCFGLFGTRYSYQHSIFIVVVVVVVVHNQMNGVPI